MDDKEYWTKFYSTNPQLNNPSTFAQFAIDYLDEGKNLIDMGCGNGRDTVFFALNNINALGVDQVEAEIDNLSKTHNENDKLNFKADDFTRLDPAETKYDYVYSRFTFHSIPEKNEDMTLDWIEENIQKDGLFLLEARSIKDPMFQKGRKLSDDENCTDHYRRYLHFDKITQKIEDHGFEIIYKVESDGLAVYKDDDPVVIRVIAKKI